MDDEGNGWIEHCDGQCGETGRDYCLGHFTARGTYE